MTYKTEQQKTEMTGLAELYEFQVGSAYYRYTSYPSNLDFAGNAYKAVPIQRSPYTVDKKFQAVTVDISAGLVDPLPAMIANYPVQPVRVRIYRAVKSDLTLYRLVFSGVVKPIEIENKVARVTCESLTEIFRAPVPGVVLQAPCNNKLFDSKCGLNSSAYKVTAIVTVTGSTLISATFAGYADAYFRKGFVLCQGDARLITEHVANTLTIQVPFDSRLATGGSVDAYPGCDLNAATCKNKFSNLTNFLGMPYVPSKNPALSGFA